MSAKRKVKIDETHPKYEEYVAKCKVLQSEYIRRSDEVEREGRRKYPDWRGQDSPWGDEELALTREINVRLKALQQEYAFLFTEV